MAGPKEPGNSGPNATVGPDSTAGSEGQSGPSDRPGARSEPEAKTTRATTGRIPSLTPLKSVSGPSVTQGFGSAPFRPNVTAYWTPPVPTSGQGQSGFIRIATPVSTRPDGVVSIVSPLSPAAAGEKGGGAGAVPRPVSATTEAADARGGVVSISTGSPAMYPETPPFGISKLAGIGGVVLDQANAQGVPSRANVARSGRIPFRVGEYEVATRLAQGGTGSIYVCRRTKTTGPLFALKVIRQHAQQKEAVISSFRREARVGKLLRHPNALTVVDEGTYEGQPFLILPYVEGGTVSSLVADGVRAPAQNIVTILLDVLRALQHAHHLKSEQGQALGMVHADISPDNILVGTDGVARLTDFGSARLAESDGEGDTFGLGKPSYMSPEQLRGEPLDMRSDIFSVGIVMWSALTGQKLFAAETYDQTVMRVMRRRIPAPSSLGAPPELDEVCLMALNRSREGRFSTADQMADALMTAAAKVDLVATRERVSHWVRRDLAEPLTEVRRRVEHMFGDNVKAPGVSGVDPARPRPASTPITGVPPAATIQMRALPRGAAAALAAQMGDKPGNRAESPARTLFIPGPSPVAAAAPRLSRRQWYIIVSLSLATFFLTLMIGSWISRPGAVRRAGAMTGPATGTVGMSRNAQ